MDQKRRNILKIMAWTPGAMLVSGCAQSSGEDQLFTWQGYALGADTSIQLYGQDKEKADVAVLAVNELIGRLESIFSLYDPGSEINQLNRDGVLEEASAEMIELIRLAAAVGAQTNGAFDITVQPLWQLYDRYRSDGDQVAFERDLKNVLPLIGADKISINGRRVSFERENMAVSFNGIAQGYITDRATALLKEYGYSHTLVDVGEYAAGGPQANGSPWRIGLLDPFDQISIAEVIELSSGGLATSGGYGTVFDDAGIKHHLFNPATGQSTNLYASVTVTAQNAATADALSTAFSAMAKVDISRVAEMYSAEVRLTFHDGRVENL